MRPRPGSSSNDLPSFSLVTFVRIAAICSNLSAWSDFFGAMNKFNKTALEKETTIVCMMACGLYTCSAAMCHRWFIMSMEISCNAVPYSMTPDWGPTVLLSMKLQCLQHNLFVNETCRMSRCWRAIVPTC